MLLSENQIIGDVEGFGIVALEANYFGLPVIGARGCGIEDAINDGYNGFLVDNKDCDEITEKTVQTILNMGNLRIQCQKWVLNFDWKKIGRVYNELIK
jgi:phosphatidylinositol alpha-1,6-mannosyltransferase